MLELKLHVIDISYRYEAKKAGTLSAEQWRCLFTHNSIKVISRYLSAQTYLRTAATPNNIKKYVLLINTSKKSKFYRHFIPKAASACRWIIFFLVKNDWIYIVNKPRTYFSTFRGEKNIFISPNKYNETYFF